MARFLSLLALNVVCPLAAVTAAPGFILALLVDKTLSSKTILSPIVPTSCVNPLRLILTVTVSPCLAVFGAVAVRVTASPAKAMLENIENSIANAHKTLIIFFILYFSLSNSHNKCVFTFQINVITLQHHMHQFKFCFIYKLFKHKLFKRLRLHR